jgi:hypothetical protein
MIADTAKLGSSLCSPVAHMHWAPADRRGSILRGPNVHQIRQMV